MPKPKILKRLFQAYCFLHVIGFSFRLPRSSLILVNVHIFLPLSSEYLTSRKGKKMQTLTKIKELLPCLGLSAPPSPHRLLLSLAEIAIRFGLARLADLLPSRSPRSAVAPFALLSDLLPDSVPLPIRVRPSPAPVW